MLTSSLSQGRREAGEPAPRADGLDHASAPCRRAARAGSCAAPPAAPLHTAPIRAYLRRPSATPVDVEPAHNVGIHAHRVRRGRRVERPGSGVSSRTNGNRRGDASSASLGRSSGRFSSSSLTRRSSSGGMQAVAPARVLADAAQPASRGRTALSERRPGARPASRKACSRARTGPCAAP